MTQLATKSKTPPPSAPRSPIYQMAERFDIEPARLTDVLKATVIKCRDRQPSNEEVVAFIAVANQYRLNPFTRELHAFVSERGGGIVPIVGIDGWAKLINSDSRFDGVDFEEIFDESSGEFLAVTCTMHVKQRAHPVRVTEWLSECKRSTIPWNTMPRRMLRHKAFMQAGRYAFGLSGIYDEDEARDIIRQELPRERGVIEMEQVQPGTEPNRGHGDERIGTPEQPPDDPPPADGPLTDAEKAAAQAQETAQYDAEQKAKGLFKEEPKSSGPRGHAK